jgi:D-alanyl-D-alanine-carboxypeptidase/D-alanyl-D-alanine-endopeptidase
MRQVRLRAVCAPAFVIVATGVGACHTSPPVSGGPQALPLTAAPAPAFPSDSAVLAMIRQRVEEKRSAGIVVGMLDATGRTRIVAFGDPGAGKLPLDGNSVFEIGSISKVFTATVLAELVKEGKVTLDDPVQKYLPPSVHLPTRNGKAITLGNLSEQNSGLPRMPSNFHPKDPANPYADYTVQQMYDFVSGYELTRDPGEQFEYSNLGVGLLGHVLSLATQQSYEQMEQKRVWSPLAMTHTAITLSPWMKEHLALGHDEHGEVVPNWDLPTFAGAGAIRSTTVDMLKFAAANLHPERGRLQAAMAFAHEERSSGGALNMRIGLNWLSLHAGADAIVWHNGGTGGYRTFLGLEPSKRIAVVVMTNSAGAGADDIGMHLLDPALPLTPKPPTPKVRVAIQLPPDRLARYVGIYEMGPGVNMLITLEKDQLFSKLSTQDPVPIFPESQTIFFLKVVDAQLEFSKEDNQGRPRLLVLHQNGHDAPMPRIDEAEAKRMADAMAARFKAQIAAPDGEAVLRRMIESLRLGQPNYELMSSTLAAATREQLPQIHGALVQLGDLLSMTFKGVGPGGADIYLVKFEHGSLEYRIWLASDGKIENANFRTL